MLMLKLSAVFRYKGGYLWARWNEFPKRTLLTAEQDHGFFEGLVNPPCQRHAHQKPSDPYLDPATERGTGADHGVPAGRVGINGMIHDPSDSLWLLRFGFGFGLGHRFCLIGVIRGTGEIG